MKQSKADHHDVEGAGVSVLLQLSPRCIEAASVSEHRRLLNAALASPRPSRSREQQLTLLKAFLEQTDFRALRARNPELAGQAQVQVELRAGTAPATVNWTLITRRA